MISIVKFFSSLKHALRGIFIVFARENSFRLQTMAMAAVLGIVVFVPLELWQRVLLILMSSAVLVLEILNTAFERISDILKPRLHPIVKEVKDMMAGAVLITSITAVVIAVLILLSFYGII
jgi:undecaprenol kinase